MTLSMLSIYGKTLSVCYPFDMTLPVCYPFMFRHCQYAIHFCYDTVSMLCVSEGLLNSKKFGEKLLWPNPVVFPRRMWVKQRRTVRVAQFYKLLHFHCTEHVVYHACIKHIAFLSLQTNVSFAASFTGSVRLREKWYWIRRTEGKSAKCLHSVIVAAELGAPRRSSLGAKLRRVSSWRNTRLVTERQMWSLEIPTSSLWGT